MKKKKVKQKCLARKFGVTTVFLRPGGWTIHGEGELFSLTLRSKNITKSAIATTILLAKHI